MMAVSECEVKIPLLRGAEHRGSALLVFDKLTVRMSELSGADTQVSLPTVNNKY